ncbi:MAG: protein kinase [Phycisphaerales bacterium]
MGRCPSASVLGALAAGSDAPRKIRRHVARCAACRQHVEQCRQNDRFLANAAEDIARALEESNAQAPGDGRPLPGAVPGFRLLEEISRGGQGVVYRAEQEQPSRAVAIKMLLGGALATPRQLRRFEREIELAAQLRHPNIVSVYQSGRASDGGRYVAMEFVEGVAIDRSVGDALGPAQPGSRARTDAVMRLMAQVAHGVAHAHAAGVIHRDLKPSNIMVDRHGLARVLDFGLARSSLDASDAAVTQEFVGTPSYAAPERLDAQPGDAGARSDVYSLGMVLYRLLTDHMPYPCEGSVLAIARHAAETAPTPPRHYVARLPADVETIVLRCLAKDPDRRYASAAALAEDIESYLHGYPIAARRESAAYVMWKLLRRNRAVTAAAAFVAVTTLVAAIGFALLAADLDRSRRDAEAALAESNVQRARLMAAGGDIDRAEAILWTESIAAGLDTGPDMPFVGTPAQLRSAWSLMEYYARLPRVVRVRTDARCDAIGFELDGNHVWAIDGLGSRISLSLEGLDITRARAPAPADEQGLATAAFASANGRYAIALHPRSAFMWNAADGNQRARLSFEGRAPSAIVPSNDGRTLVSHNESEPGWLTIRDATGQSPALRLGGGIRAVALAEHSGGPTLLAATAGSARRVEIRRPPDWQVQESIALGSEAHEDFNIPPKCLAISPDGQMLAVTLDNTVLLFDAADTSSPRTMREIETKEIDKIAFTTSGAALYVIDRDGILLSLSVPRLEIRCRIDTGRRAAAMALDAPASRIAVAHVDTDVAVYDVHDRPWLSRQDAGPVTHASIDCAMDGAMAWGDDAGYLSVRSPDASNVLSFPAHDGVITSVHFSADGAHVLSSGFDGRIAIWNRSGTQVRIVAQGLPRLWSARFSPDDAWIAVGAADGTARLWRNEAGATPRIIEIGAARVPMVRFSPDGNRLLCAAVSDRRQAVLLDVETGLPLAGFDGGNDFIRAVAWSPDGSTVAVASDERTIRISDARTGRPIQTIAGLPWGPYDLAYHPGGAILFAVGPGGSVFVFDARSGAELAKLPVHDHAVFSIALGPDGSTILTSGEDDWIGISSLDHLRSYVRGNAGYWRDPGDAEPDN